MPKRGKNNSIQKVFVIALCSSLLSSSSCLLFVFGGKQALKLLPITEMGHHGSKLHKLLRETKVEDMLDPNVTAAVVIPTDATIEAAQQVRSNQNQNNLVFFLFILIEFVCFEFARSSRGTTCIVFHYGIPITRQTLA